MIVSCTVLGHTMQSPSSSDRHSIHWFVLAKCFFTNEETSRSRNNPTPAPTQMSQIAALPKHSCFPELRLDSCSLMAARCEGNSVPEAAGCDSSLCWRLGSEKKKGTWCSEY